MTSQPRTAYRPIFIPDLFSTLQVRGFRLLQLRQARLLLAGLAGVLLVSAPKAPAQTRATESILYNFSPFSSQGPENPDGGWPLDGVIQGSDGNFYGATPNGGANGYGTAYKVTPIGVITILHTFSYLEGNPTGALLQGKDGNLYGTSGAIDDGTTGSVFQLTTTGVFTSLHFSDDSYGFDPADLIEDKDGNLYGTVLQSKGDGGEAIFRLAIGDTLTTLHEFVPNGDTRFGFNGLIRDSEGNFFGTGGGTYLLPYGEGGSICEVTSAGVFKVLHTFSAPDNNDDNADGFGSDSNLVRGKDGNFYGIAGAGGGTHGKGTVYRITPAGDLTTIYNLATEVGAGSSLVAGRDGDLYGSLKNGGTPGQGLVFKITTAGAFTPLYSFSGSDGAYPLSGLIEASDGNLYGTTLSGGANGTGVIFKVTLTPPALPIVALKAINLQVTAGTGRVGEFALLLSVPQDHALTVNFLIRGSAVDGTDYKLLSTTETIPAGTTSKLIRVVPKKNAEAAPSSRRTVILRLQPGDGYVVGTTGKVEVTIRGK